ncbi:NAD(P)H-hydrate dehydratase [Noviherbaspirillum sedimenti]|uniref:Bifunctional NAD(P)H-hydrate repair enzyme n=1 Tax=Noviherbaspirillum sedimenti TaxID=2320865 RepID=A0A3A3G0E5_9BURK|nr:NAD(P)H-hydrate dehydratase [Noviherbaspirillum sedimenti]RJG01105.1 NAD(P)H-hydrate dehydratase [Noviherbaspirillum sedimenti]
MNELYTVAEIRQIEQAALAGLPAGTLMQRAGAAAMQMALAMLDNASIASAPRVLVLAGPGNNGGDALDVAARLAQAGIEVTVALYAVAERQPQDARAALGRAQAGAATLLAPGDPGDSAAPSAAGSIYQRHWDLVIDGLFGIGLARPLAGAMRAMVEFINTLPCQVLALDIPSGLDADTGDIVGPGGIAVRAHRTITFIADKPGLHTCHGRDHAGQVSIATLDIDPALLPPAQAFLNGPILFADALRPRPQNSHKGSFGDVAVLGGAHGMQGAPILAARAALHCGAGRVFACFVDEAPGYDPAQPELMCRHAGDFDFSKTTVVAGPGSGGASRANELLARVLDLPVPLVLDADALNLVAADRALQQRLAARTGATILTPHPLEAARLLAVSAGVIQADRLAAARQLAARFQAIVILKGSGSVIARPDGSVAINPSGNPALATAGTGDVLAGVCGALLAQHLPPWQAALSAAWLHGHAADRLVEAGVGPVGLSASELIPAIRTALNALNALCTLGALGALGAQITVNAH